MKPTFIIAIVVVFIVGFILYQQTQVFPIPEGESVVLDESVDESLENDSVENNQDLGDAFGKFEVTENTEQESNFSERQIFVTDDVKHSIPLDDILAGGPAKDGIPSIDNPKFWTASEGDAFLDDDNIGLGLEYKGETRFYPFRILVWHEIVNDTIQGDSVLVTYCPLCLTGIVFEGKVLGEPQEFGVSGRLWQSNLLMYNRAATEDDESLWSQVLGEAVLGINTGEKLKIIPSDIVKWEDWRKLHPNSKVLSADTGTGRNYSQDPYGDYYTNSFVSYGASFNDSRLHPKALVVGIELDGKYKAYDIDTLKVGETTDNFSGETVSVNKDSTGRIRISTNGEEIPTVWGFWFSWLAVHPETELLK